MAIIVINAGKVIVSKNEIKFFRLKSKNGFTLVELSLSMVFISILSIIIVLVINGTVSSYRRGITLNLLNTVGSELISDITTAVQESPIDGELCHNDDDDESCRYASRTNYAEVEGERIPVSGAFCTGKSSYVWNSGYYFDGSSSIEGDGIRIVIDGVEPRHFRLMKIINDVNRIACRKNTKDGLDVITIKGRNDNVESVLDDKDNSGVAVYNFEVDPPVDGGSGGQLYIISLTLGTAQSGMNINAAGGKCAAPAESNSNPDYCAINTFRFAALANGGKSNEGE